MLKVILIGGSPMVGKSTIARIMASKMMWSCLSTDDIGEILQTAIKINPMCDQNYIDYYTNTDIDKLIEDIKLYHSQLQPAISRLIDIHSTWGNPLIIEGWAIYPELLKNIDCTFVDSVWLISDKKLLEKRLETNINFHSQTNESHKWLEKYLARSLWHNNLLLQQCKLQNKKYLCVNGDESPDDLIETIFQMLYLPQ